MTVTLPRMIGASGLDWGHELFHSLWWIAKGFALTAAIFLMIAAALIKFTGWGRMFWRITGGYFTGRHSWAGWGLLGIVVLLAVYSVRIQVLFTYYYNDMYSSLQLGVQALAGHDASNMAHAKTLFWHSMIVFTVLATIFTVMVMVTYWLNYAFQIHWWKWLNQRYLDDWLSGKAYYRNRFIDNTIDNADQRIQQDTQDFVNGIFALAFGGTVGPYAVSGSGVIGSGLTVVSFTPILWKLSLPLNVLGWHLPRALVFSVFIFTVVVTAVAFWIGHPLIRLNFLFQRRTADYRFGLVRLRENAENVAFYHGEREERAGLDHRFDAVIDNAWQRVYRLIKFYGWNQLTNQVTGIFVGLIMGPQILEGITTLGNMQQAGSAFTSLQAAVSMPQNSYDAFTYVRATLVRLDGLRDADEKSRTLPSIDTSTSSAGLELVDVTVTKPDGTPLINDLSLRLHPGDALVVKGKSGAGKTTLLRSIGELWPYTTGSVRRPMGNDTLFLSQRPYLPLGNLRDAISYPGTPGSISDQTLRETLIKVNLGHLVDRLDDDDNWGDTLSPGEQQRIGFARILLLRPKLAFLDEATSAVDEGLEYTLYHLVRSESPDTVLVSVAHRSTVDRHHNHRLEISGSGEWNLSPAALSA